MRRVVLLMLLALPVKAAAAPSAKLGEWIEVSGESLLPQVGLTLDLPDDPQPGLYRQIALNWHDRPLQAGAYPAPAFAARKEGAVGLSLAIAADGRLTACEMTKSSGDESLDAHACRHLLQHTAYHPGLDDRGQRLGGTVPATLEYTLRAGSVTLAGGGGEEARPAKPAIPLTPITLDTLGFPKGVRVRPQIGGVSATLAVDAEGAVAACLVTSPTFADLIDAGACDRLRRLRFQPALDAERRPVASHYTVSLGFRR